MTAVFEDFESDMAQRIVLNTDSEFVEVTFRNSGNTYRFSLDQADVSDIVNVATARSKGRLLHEILDIRNGTLVSDLTSSTVRQKVAVAV